jgi:fucose permease
MPSHSRHTEVATLPVLHGAFALTGVLHAVGGALLPSIAFAFHLSDKQSGTLFLLYYAGTSLGALLCVSRYVRLMGAGFLVVTATCIGIAMGSGTALKPLFLILGIGVGIPMTAVSMYAGAKFGDRSAAPLTFLNFSWSAGALVAPLFAAQVLLAHSYRAAYGLLAGAALAAAAACWMVLQDPPERRTRVAAAGARDVRWIALFAFLTFLEVGIENTTATWLATYSLRTSESGAAMAAASSSLYWCGFLASRGVFALLLLRIAPGRVLGATVLVALLASALVIGLPGTAGRDLAMLLLGAALAPIFPLLLSRFFAHARHASDSRWVLAICGFGGSVMPWVTGWASASFGSLRVGLATVPAALALLALLLPVIRGQMGSDAGLAE